MLYFARGSKTDVITADDTRAILKQVFDAMGPRKRVLALPPDFTRANSYAGPITEMVYDYFGDKLTDVMPALGTHSPMTPEQIKASEGRTKPWGTVHALLSAKDVVKTPFTVINADDYYGREAYAILGDYLSKIDNDSDEHAMVGYFLKNTMSPAGSVSRGVCSVKDGLLQGMRENTKIEFEGKKIVSHLPEGDVHLTGDEWVSMNFFGFSPKVFGLMMDYFERFMAENASQPKAEVLLPNFAGEMVQTGKGRMKVFSTSEKWFGMTYKEDRETVKQNLALKTKEGIYPERLWER